MASRLKRSNCPKWKFFSKSNKMFMYLLAPFILQNFRGILWAHPELSGCAIFSHKMVHLSWTNFFLAQTIIITFIYLFAIFVVQNLQQILVAHPRLWRCPIFWPKMVHLTQTIFFGKLSYHFHLTISSFHCAKFHKNPSSGSRVTRMWNFWAYNGPFTQMRLFSENLLINLVSFIHAYLHAKNKSQILIY